MWLLLGIILYLVVFSAAVSLNNPFPAWFCVSYLYGFPIVICLMFSKFDRDKRKKEQDEKEKNTPKMGKK